MRGGAEQSSENEIWFFVDLSANHGTTPNITSQNWLPALPGIENAACLESATKLLNILN